MASKRNIEMLTDGAILQNMATPNPNNPNGKPNIIIDPFDKKCLGSNSYDLHLVDKLLVYGDVIPKGMKPAIKYEEGRKYSMQDWFTSEKFFLDYKRRPEEYDLSNPKYLINPFNKNKEIIELNIPEDGLIISPNIGYLSATMEYTETYNLVPCIDGRSSVGRNFIMIHNTAGFGDVGFCGTWTLEIKVSHPTLIKSGMRIGQIYYYPVEGEILNPYNKKADSHYNGQISPTGAAAIQIESIKNRGR
ncbi:MAG: hypothetical protein LBD94_03525 [Rickettsiales bacterium]|jgi:dCTP deaminase|nr:hypothetical protein [Rickettsiales bacterium]